MVQSTAHCVSSIRLNIFTHTPIHFEHHFCFSADTIAHVRINGNTTERDGVKYVTFNKIVLRVSVGRARYNMENLFNGDPALGALGNQFINENAKLFVDEMIPFIEKSLAKTFLDIINVVFKEVTFDEMFPDTPVAKDE